MASVGSMIIDMFQGLTLAEKTDVIQELNRLLLEELQGQLDKETPSYLQEKWTEIKNLIRDLSYEPYIDDQIELSMIWDICEEMIQSGCLQAEQWDVKESIIREIIETDYYNDYSITDPMQDLMNALCTTKEEKLRCADLIFALGSDFIKMDGAKIYKENGCPEKYYEYLEQRLSYKKAPYMELIGYYKDIDPDKAAMIAELGMKKCREDQTEFLIYLLQQAQLKGEQEKVNKFMKSAKLRQKVNYERVLSEIN